MTTPSSTPGNPSQKPGAPQVLVPVAVILALILVGLSFLKSKTHSSSAPNHSYVSGSASGPFDLREGAILPDFQFTSVKGEFVPLSSFSKNKVILINFWATWCGPCLSEMPSINALWKKYHDQGFAVIGVNVDENPEEVLAPFEKKLGMPFPSFIDPHGNASEQFSIEALPFSLVIDSQRKILLAGTGDQDWDSDSFQRRLKGWLGKSTP